jgi:anti-anti-sigma factor
MLQKIVEHHQKNHSSLAASFPSDLSQLERVREFVRRMCVGLPGDVERMTEELQLAINEIFCNIVKHGYRGKSNGCIEIRVESDRFGLMMMIADQGVDFNPAAVPEPSLSRSQEDGFGWYIVRRLIDRVKYTPKRSPNGWNRLSLYKNYHFGAVSMDITHENREHVLVITPKGENLDAKEAPEFKDKVIRLIAEKRAHQVIFDLHQIQFIDSSGLGSFLSVLRHLNTQGGDLKLACMGKPVRSMFELVSMHKIFEIFNTTDDALRSFNSHAGR